LDIDGQTGCALVDIRENALFIREVLLQKSLLTQGVHALLAHFGKTAATYRTPTQFAPDLAIPFTLITFPQGNPAPAEVGYFPFVLD